jgi:hypothetical protein
MMTDAPGVLRLGFSDTAHRVTYTNQEAKQSKAKQSKAKQSKAKQSKAKQSKAKKEG